MSTKHSNHLKSSLKQDTVRDGILRLPVPPPDKLAKELRLNYAKIFKSASDFRTLITTLLVSA